MHKALVGFVGLIAAVCAPLQAGAQQRAGGTPPNTFFKQLRLDGNFVRWQKADEASTLVLTYKVLDGFQAFDGARNCRRMTGIDGIAKRSHLDRETFDVELHAALTMWEAAADIRFREASENEPANILIGAQAEPEGWAFADVFYDAKSSGPVKPISRSLVCLNPMKTWKIGFDGDLRVYDLRYTLAHEIGHAIGLDHPNSAGQIMGYRYEESFRDLQAGDQSGAVALYGPSRAMAVARTPAPATTGSLPEAMPEPANAGATSRALP